MTHMTSHIIYSAVIRQILTIRLSQIFRRIHYVYYDLPGKEAGIYVTLVTLKIMNEA